MTFSYKTCQPVPEHGGRCYKLGVGLVEVDGKAVWGGNDGYGGVYVLDEASSKWERVADGVRFGATLAVCGGKLVSVGGRKDGGNSKDMVVLRGGKWTSMSTMLVGCHSSGVFSISGGLVVMGGWNDGLRDVRDVQVFDGESWHFGPPLPKKCYGMSAVVHGDLVFLVGGRGMKRAVWSANITDLVSH